MMMMTTTTLTASSSQLPSQLSIVVVVWLSVFGLSVVYVSSYPCVATSSCVKKLMTKMLNNDSNFFIFDVTGEDFRSNCSEAQKCLNDVTGGGNVVSDVTTAAVSFFYDVCSEDRQNQFTPTLKNCILNGNIRHKAEIIHRNFMSTRDKILPTISKQRQITKLCLLLNGYLKDLGDALKSGGCTNAVDFNWCLKMIREALYEKYGAFCPCTGNCDCKNGKSSVTRGNGIGAAYLMIVFGIFLLIGCLLIKKSKQRN